MADGITVGGSLRHVTGSGKEDQTVSVRSHTKTQSAAGAVEGIQNIGTTEEAIDMGDVSTPGYAYFRNLDATNYVEVGMSISATFEAFAKLDPGDFCILPLASGQTYQAKANTAAVELKYKILED